MSGVPEWNDQLLYRVAGIFVDAPILLEKVAASLGVNEQDLDPGNSDATEQEKILAVLCAWLQVVSMSDSCQRLLDVAGDNVELKEKLNVAFADWRRNFGWLSTLYVLLITVILQKNGTCFLCSVFGGCGCSLNFERHRDKKRSLQMFSERSWQCPWTHTHTHTHTHTKQSKMY